MTKLIHSAGLAIQALSNTRSRESDSTDNSLESHKTAFKAATAQYFALLSSIDVRLRRQVYALEEAAILAPEPTSRMADAAGGAGGPPGSVNPLEISWLNSRKDTVGKDKEAELWAAAKEFVSQIQTEKTFSTTDGDTKMEVD